MRQYRIKQINDNKYIPQTTGNIFAQLFGEWKGIEYCSENYTDEWYSEYSQRQYCIVTTMEAAKYIIEIHKTQQTYPKYHPYNS